MAKRKQRLKPDIIAKKYWNNNERFADFFNAVLFQGEQVIKPEELEDVDTEGSFVLEHRKYAESIQAARDNIKVRKRYLARGVELVMLGNEGQEHIHYAMPLRVMGYDYGTYKKQYDSNAENYATAKGLDRDEYLSKMKRTDKFIPVITVVVYYGEKPWNGATTLQGMLNIGEEIAPYVNDYKILLVEARQNNLTLHNMSNVAFFNLLEILLDENKTTDEIKRKAIEYTEKHEVDRTVVMAVAGVTNNKIDYNILDKRGDSDMCRVFEEMWEEGRREGREEGRAEEIIETGFEFGLPENDILERLQDKLNISLQKAQGYFNRFRKQTV